MLAGAILRKTKVLSQAESIRHISILFSGKVGVYFIALVSQPILARLYSPTHFGEFAFLNSLLAILVAGSSLRYESGIVLTRKPEHARRLFQLSQLILMLSTSVMFLVIIIDPIDLTDQLTALGLSKSSLWLIPFLVFSAGYWEIMQAWLSRFRKYKNISIALFSQRLLILSGSIAAIFLPLPGNGLITGLVLGNLGILLLAFYTHREPFSFPIKGIRRYAHHYREFPYYSVPSLYILLIIQHLPVFWINYFFDKSLTGSYSMAFTIAMLPLTILTMGTFTVYYERLAQSADSVKLTIVHTFVKYFSLILFPFTLILFFFGKQLIVLFLGAEWTEAGYLVSLLAPIGFLQGLSSCLTIPLTVLKKQKLFFFFQILKLGLWSAALGLSYFTNDIFLSVKLLSPLYLIHFLLIVAIVYPLIRKSFGTALKQKAKKGIPC